MLQENEENQPRVEEEGSLVSIVNRLTKRLDDYEARLKRVEGYFAPESPRPGKPGKTTSIREFLIIKQPKSDVEKTLVIGYFLERMRGLSSFNARDLNEGFREAKENVPANVNLAVIGNIQKGYFMEAGEKKEGLKAWTLTNHGLSAFEESRAAA